MTLSKIVITGGPCAGKSTAMSYIQNHFTQKGYTVLFVPETATELISGGVSPVTCGTNADFQKCQFRLQLEKERVFEYAAQTMGKKKMLIVCDRGALDNKAYMTDEEFSSVLKSLDMDEVTLRDNYDAVFHLVSAAKGAESFYTKANNSARSESVEEAARLDDKLIYAWTGHPHLRVIDNSTDFSDKLNRLITEISAYLGEPEPMETERKFLIDYPDIDALENMPSCTRVEIIQTYLKNNKNVERFVRQRGSNNSFIYYLTLKKPVENGHPIEVERRLTPTEYLSLLMEVDTEKRQIRKTRYCLTHNNLYHIIDVYPFWKDKAILKIKMSDTASEPQIPEMIKIIKDVTDSAEYTSDAIAKRS